jgi:hypothetical protein
MQLCSKHDWPRHGDGAPLLAVEASAEYQCRGKACSHMTTSHCASHSPAQPTMGRVVSLRLPCAGGGAGRRPPGFRVRQWLAVHGAQILGGVCGQREALGTSAQLLQEAGSRRQRPAGPAQHLTAQLRSSPASFSGIRRQQCMHVAAAVTVHLLSSAAVGRVVQGRVMFALHRAAAAATGHLQQGERAANAGARVCSHELELGVVWDSRDWRRPCRVSGACHRRVARCIQK